MHTHTHAQLSSQILVQYAQNINTKIPTSLYQTKSYCTQYTENLNCKYYHTTNPESHVQYMCIITIRANRSSLPSGLWLALKNTCTGCSTHGFWVCHRLCLPLHSLGQCLQPEWSSLNSPVYTDTYKHTDKKSKKARWMKYFNFHYVPCTCTFSYTITLSR